MLTVGIRAITAGGLAYREYLPEASLRNDVEYVWTMEAAHALCSPLVQTSASKASLDLIVPLDGHFCARAEQHLFGPSGHGAYLVGALSRPSPIVTAGRCTAVGARFRPGRAATFFGMPMHELTDRVLALAAVDGALERQLSGRAHESRQSQQRAQVVQRVLQGFRRPGRRDGGRGPVLAALRLIEEHGGAIGIEALAEAVGSGVRQLERRFRELVGIGPKLACRIARVRRAMSSVPLRSGESWADLVHSCGFYDQAHFIREFRAVAGVTPGQFAAEATCDGTLSHSYNTGSLPRATVAW